MMGCLHHYWEFATWSEAPGCQTAPKTCPSCTHAQLRILLPTGCSWTMLALKTYEKVITRRLLIFWIFWTPAFSIWGPLRLKRHLPQESWSWSMQWPQRPPAIGTILRTSVYCSRGWKSVRGDQDEGHWPTSQIFGSNDSTNSYVRWNSKWRWKNEIWLDRNHKSTTMTVLLQHSLHLNHNNASQILAIQQQHGPASRR